MNNRHPSGNPDPAAPAPDASSAHYGSYDQQSAQHGHAGYDGYATGTFDQLATGFDEADGSGAPLYGAYSDGQDGGQQHLAHDQGFAYDGGYDGQSTGQYDAGQWNSAYDDQSTGYDTGSYDTTGGWAQTTGYPQHAGSPYAGADADSSGQWDASAWGGAGQTEPGTFEASPYDTGQFAAGQFVAGPADTGQVVGGPFATGTFDAGSFTDQTYDTGQFDTGQWNTGTPLAPGHHEVGHQDIGHLDSGRLDTGAHDSGQWDTRQWDTGQHASGPYGSTQWDTGSFQVPGGADLAAPADQRDEVPAGAPGTYDDGVWDTGSFATTSGADASGYEQPYQQARPDEEHTGAHEQAYDAAPEAEPERTAAMPVLSEADLDAPYDPDAVPGDTSSPLPSGHSAPAPAEPGTRAARRRQQPEAAVATAPPARRDGGRGRRRPATRSRRSAILTVAVPSVAVMGVAAVAAASVSGVGGDGDKKGDATAQAAPDRAPVQPTAANSKLDTQLAGLTEEADNFANRASRTQERIDLRERQAAEKKRKIEEAARKEAMRPKFALPVAQHGLSAGYGQAGINWMSVHTGIDFPVDYGTPVMAATDGTVRTQFNVAYGNMAIVTSPDGTETWYCHLGSTKLRSGSVQAGDTIAYSGDSGNSTGPHLHFEVRPGGGSAVDPLTWLRGHGLDPT
ncbi:peptidoglycan DD-metalloendopeptidase family protein [Streptomyces sp. NPDC057702]|uniref:M23 family metallopeptidase n=1 Tax=unclassified Streptomyces TaxID=2593676 RepID=UPI0036C34AA9